MLTGILSGCVLAAGFLLLAAPSYRAQMIVGPASPLAAPPPAASKNIFLEDDPLLARFKTMLSGPLIAGNLLKDEAISEGLAADRSFLFSSNKEIDNPARLSDYIKRRVRIEPVGETRQERLVYYHPDPVFAVYLLNLAHSETDRHIRSAARAETLQRIRYLEKAIKASDNPDQRRALTTLLMSQARLLMLVSLDQPYAANIVEPPASSFKPKWPDPALIFAGFIMAGAIAGFAFYGFMRKT